MIANYFLRNVYLHNCTHIFLSIYVLEAVQCVFFNLLKLMKRNHSEWLRVGNRHVVDMIPINSFQYGLICSLVMHRFLQFVRLISVVVVSFAHVTRYSVSGIVIVAGSILLVS